MVADLLFRVACHGGGDEPLNVHLKRITDSAHTRKTLGGVAIEGQLVAPIIAESHDEECRREIMTFLRECLSETSGRRWQRIYGGLALTENLMQHGSPALLTEVARGHHFDLVQKVSILEYFDAAARGCSDRRAQTVVRAKAKELRSILVPLIEKERAEDMLQSNILDSKDTASTCSSGGISTATPSTAASSTSGSPFPSVIESTCSTPEAPQSPAKDAHIDDAFAELRSWMESKDGSPRMSAESSPRLAPEDLSGLLEEAIVSAESSPRSSPGDSELSLDDFDWEPLEGLPPSYITDAAMQATFSGISCTSASMSDGCDDVFFTPMPAPALARTPMQTAAMFSRCKPA
jgi:hypothetical protein